MTIRLGINFSAEKITQKIHDTTVHPDSVGNGSAVQRIQFVEVPHLTYYNYNRLPDEFTTIQAQIEMYILNLTKAERNVRRKY